MHMLHTGYNLQHYLKMSQMVIVSQIELKKDLLTERNERKFTCVLHYIFNYRDISFTFYIDSEFDPDIFNTEADNYFYQAPGF